MENKTADDAFQRVLGARTGSFVDASDTYLLALRSNLYSWIARIDSELAIRIEASNKREHNDENDEES